MLTEKYKPTLVEPDPDDEKYDVKPATISTESAPAVKEANRDLRSLGVDAASKPAPAPTTIFIPDTTAFARFQHDHNKYEKGQKKIKAARTLIKDSVNTIIAGIIRDKDDPVVAYKFLKEKYKLSDSASRQKLLSQLKDATLNKFKYNVEDYVNRVFEIREDLRDYSKELSDEELAEYLLGGLPDLYGDFKEKYS